jgi:hypothetical protein
MRQFVPAAAVPMPPWQPWMLELGTEAGSPDAQACCELAQDCTPALTGVPAAASVRGQGAHAAQKAAGQVMPGPVPRKSTH